MFASLPEYSIIIPCQIFSVGNGDISICDDIDLDQMMFASLDKKHRGEDNKNFDTSREGCMKLKMNFVLSCHVTVIFKN